MIDDWSWSLLVHNVEQIGFHFESRSSMSVYCSSMAKSIRGMTDDCFVYLSTLA